MVFLLLIYCFNYFCYQIKTTAIRYLACNWKVAFRKQWLRERSLSLRYSIGSFTEFVFYSCTAISSTKLFICPVLSCFNTVLMQQWRINLYIYNGVFQSQIIIAHWALYSAEHNHFDMNSWSSKIELIHGDS